MEPLPEWIQWIREAHPPDRDPSGCLRCGGVGYVEVTAAGDDQWLAPDGRSQVPFGICPECQSGPDDEDDEPLTIRRDRI